MYKLFISALVALLIFTSANAQQKVWSLQECMDYAIENNLQVQQQELDLLDADIDIQNAKGSLLPNLSAGASNTWNNGINQVFIQSAANPFGQTERRRQTIRNSQYNINSNIPIYNGLQNYNRIQQAKLQKIASQYNIDRLKDDIRINIANTYLQILLEQENLAVLEAQNDITLEQINRTQQLIDAGNLPKGDILELKANEATNIQNIAVAKNNINVAVNSLKQLLNLPFGDKFAVQKMEATLDDLSILNASVGEILSEVLTNRNEIKFAEQNIAVANKQVKITKGGFQPTLNGFAGASTAEFESSDNSLETQFEDNFRYNYGLSLNIPIFSRYQNKNAVSRSKVSVLRSKFQLEQTKQRVTQNVYQAYLDAQASDKAYEAAKVAVDAQKQAYEYAKERFEVGITNSLDFTQAKIQYQNSQTQLVRSKYDLLFKLKLLELYYNGDLDE